MYPSLRFVLLGDLAVDIPRVWQCPANDCRTRGANLVDCRTGDRAVAPSQPQEQLDPVEYVVAITFVSGATLLGFGLARFGYLDNVLSASLLKGFIAGVGIVMIITALILFLA
ncbi:hypothetical protein Cantr_10854 [Candida viswanathii]|uniref:SLC26A/SulP transporter domain-containing protein n=1 Tax=Candida viswanathii TaxID=5486 RepID=A0A367YDL7_9ASCO|nr:hypothetical protein Cantr_10854 [Candida viswanathii]